MTSALTDINKSEKKQLLEYGEQAIKAFDEPQQEVPDAPDIAGFPGFDAPEDVSLTYGERAVAAFDNQLSQRNLEALQQQPPELQIRGAQESIAQSSAYLSAFQDDSFKNAKTDKAKLTALNNVRKKFGLGPQSSLPPLVDATEELLRNVKLENAPLIGGFETARQLWNARDSVIRVENGTATADDWLRLAQFMQQSVQDSQERTFFGGVASIGATSASAMVDFLVSGGFASLFKKGAKKTVGKAIETGVKKKLSRVLAEKLIKAAGNSVLRLPVFAHRLVADQARFAMPQFAASLPDDPNAPVDFVVLDKGQGQLQAAKNALVNTYIEIFSEQTGEALALLGGPIASKARKLVGLKAAPATKVGVNAFLEAAGFHGVLNEVGEERVGEVLREAATRLGAAELPQQLPTGKQLAQELTAFSIPGAVGAAASRVGRPRETLAQATGREASAASQNTGQQVAAPTETLAQATGREQPPAPTLKEAFAGAPVPSETPKTQADLLKPEGAASVLQQADSAGGQQAEKVRAIADKEFPTRTDFEALLPFVPSEVVETTPRPKRAEFAQVLKGVIDAQGQATGLQETRGQEQRTQETGKAAAQAEAKGTQQEEVGVRASSQSTTATPIKIGDNVSVLGVDSTLAKSETIDGVTYELYNDARFAGKGGAIRIVNADTSDVITVKRHASFDAAEEEFNKAVELSQPPAIIPDAQHQPSYTFKATDRTQAEQLKSLLPENLQGKVKIAKSGSKAFSKANGVKIADAIGLQEMADSIVALNKKKAEVPVARRIEPVIPEPPSAVSPPPNEGGKTPISIKNASTDRERVKRGLPPAMQPARKADQESFDEAMRQIESNPLVQDELIADLQKKPFPASAVQNMLLLHRQIDLQNQEAKVLEELQSSPNDIELHRQASLLRDLLQQLYDVTKLTGTEQGRALRIRQVLAQEDFSLLKMLARTKEAKDVIQLSQEDELAVAAAERRIAQSEKRLRDIQERIDELLATRASLEKQRELRATKSKKPQSKPAQKSASKLKSSSQISRYAQKLAKYFVSIGITKRDPLIDAVHVELVKVLPELTRRDTMDAISGYGQFSPLSKDEIDVALRDLKGQMQQIAKLEDIQAGNAPLKTGIERRAPTDEERRLIAQVNELIRRGGFTVTDPETQLKSALSAIKTRLRNQIADLESQIESGERIVKTKTETPKDAETKELIRQRDELKKQFDEIFGIKEMSDAQRTKNAIAAVRRSIAEYERRIGERDLTPKKRVPKTRVTPELQALRDRRDALKAEFKELQDIANPKKTPEERQLAALKTRLRNRTAEYQERLANKDFAPRKRNKTPLDKEAEQARFENEQAKVDFLNGLRKFERARRTTARKIGDFAVDAVFDFTKVIRAGIDASFFRRQGGIAVFQHPIKSSKLLKEAFQAMYSKAHTSRIMHQLSQMPNAKNGLYARIGLDLPEIGGKLSQRSEEYMSRLADDIPLLAGSQRAFITFLNLLRVTQFELMATSVGKGGTVTEREAKVIANYVNASTGRVPELKRAIGLASRLFFSAQFAVSRFQFIAKGLTVPFGRADTVRVRKAIARENARYLAGVSTVLSSSALALYAAFGPPGDDKHWNITLDLNSSDFGKIRIGETRIDILSGLGQALVFLTKEFTGKSRKLRSKKVVPIRGDRVPFGGDTGASLAGRFLRQKLAPAPAAIVDIASGRNVIGEPVTPVSVTKSLTVPFSMSDVQSYFREHGIAGGLGLELLQVMGDSVNVFEKKSGGAGGTFILPPRK